MMDIESLAVSAVTRRVSRTDRLKSFINVNDKEPMWDGYIYVYENDSKTNKSFKDKIPIQVKGKEVSKIGKKDKIRYSVKTVCLNKYRNNGGIMYFVVYLTKEAEKIFYASLLPFKINDLLDKKGKQQSISIKLKELPDGDKEFESIADWFIDNRKKQLNEIKGKNLTIEVLQENFKKDLVLHIIYSFLENEGYIYAENKDLNLPFAVEHLENIKNLRFVNYNYCISANGNSYSYRAIVSHYVTHKGESIVDIGKSFKLIINEKTRKASFKINIKGYLEDRIKAYKFLLDVIDGNGKMYFNGGEQPLKLPKKSLLKLNINRNDYEKCLKNLELLKEVLYFFHVKEPLDLDKVTKEQHIYIDMLIYYFSHKEEGVKFNEEPPINGTIIIGNIKIMLFFVKMQDGRYKIYDFFRYNKINIYVDYKEKRYLTTRFSALKADEYLNVANIDFEIIEKEFKLYTNVGNYGVVNDSCIEMIRAYDKDNKRVDILDMAIRLYDWLIREDGDNLMYVINKFQCYKRKREFWDEEVKWLEEQLLNNKELSEASIASIYTLLGNKESTKMHIEKFNEEDEQSFYGFPIESLYNKL